MKNKKNSHGIDHDTGLVKSDSEVFSEDDEALQAEQEESKGSEEAPPLRSPQEDVKWDQGQHHGSEGPAVGHTQGVLTGEEAEKFRQAEENRVKGISPSEEELDAGRKEYEQKVQDLQAKEADDQRQLELDREAREEDLRKQAKEDEG